MSLTKLLAARLSDLQDVRHSRHDQARREARRRLHRLCVATLPVESSTVISVECSVDHARTLSAPRGGGIQLTPHPPSSYGGVLPFLTDSMYADDFDGQERR